MRPVALRVHPVHWHLLRFMLRQRAALAAGEQRWLRRGVCCIRSPGRRLEARLACAPARRSVACALALALLRLSMSAGPTTVMVVCLPCPAPAARAEPARISGLEIPAPNNTIILM